MSTKLVGILNITPDSFSDGGKFNSFEGALTHLKQMLEEGADMIDIGAESTRPNHIPVAPEEEWKRLEKILPAIISEVKIFNQKSAKKVTTSIDTRHFFTAKKSYEAGIDIINDVSGLVDEKIIDLIAKNNITTILMHNSAIQSIAGVVINRNLNLTAEILKWAEDKISYLEKRGVKKSQLIFDVGIGFGKDSLQAVGILKNIEAYRRLDLPLYVGHSKKSFLDIIDFSDFYEAGEEFDRAEKTLVISKYLAKKNVDFIRIHDVARNLALINSNSKRS